MDIPMAATWQVLYIHIAGRNTTNHPAYGDKNIFFLKKGHFFWVSQPFGGYFVFIIDPESFSMLPLVIFQLKSRIEKNTSINIQKRRVIEQTIPLLVTGTGWPKHIV